MVVSIVFRMSNIRRRGTRPRPLSDPVEAAARSLRGIQRAQMRYRWARTTVVCAAIGIAVLALASIVTGFLDDTGSAAAVLTVTVLAAAGLNYAMAWYGAAVMVASMAVAAVVTVVIGSRLDAGWAQLVAIGAIVASTVAVLTARRLRFPRTPTAVIAQWCAPAGLVFGIGAGVVAAAVIATVGPAAVVAAGADMGTWWAARRASRRSNIPMRPGSNLAPALTGFADPPSMTSTNLQLGIEAEQWTAAELATLGPEWTVLHSRSIPGTNVDVDHVVIGPPGVVLVDSKYRHGRLDYLGSWSAPRDHVETEDSSGHDQDSRWELNNRDASFLAHASVFEAACIDDLLAMPPGRLTTSVVLAVHGATMNTASGTMMVTTDDGHSAEVHVVVGSHVTNYLCSLPALGKSAAFLSDLAVVVDYLLPPKLEHGIGILPSASPVSVS